jgi:hypothetical protein
VLVVGRPGHPRVAVAQEVDSRHPQRARRAGQLGSAQRGDVGVAIQQLGRDAAALAARRAGVVDGHARRAIARERPGVAEALVVGVGVEHQQCARGRCHVQP